MCNTKSERDLGLEKGIDSIACVIIPEQLLSMIDMRELKHLCVRIAVASKQKNTTTCKIRCTIRTAYVL